MRRAAVVGSSVVATMAVAVAVVVIEQPGRQRVVKSGASQASTVAPPPTATVSTAAPTVTAASPAAWSGPPIACGTLSLPWNAPAGRQVSTSATLGGVSATFSGTSVARAYSDPTISGAHLTITAGGAAPHSEQVFGSNDRHGGPATNPEVVPWSLSASPPDPAKVDSQDASPGWTALCLARFAGDSQPTVLLGLDLGGAHCCALVRAYTVSPNSTALSYVEEGFGNSAGRLQTDGDHAILVTADDTFNYAFTSYAASATPVKVLDFQHGAFVNVTRQHLDLVRAEVPSLWTLVQQRPDDPLGILAAWVADRCLLGESTQAWAQVDQLLQQGRLHVAGSIPGVPDGAAYVQKLHAFLTQGGYC